ncbi:MAG TPA: DUF2851 family protein [Puia sp.]|nr:DUF2851 family protein [Puia sp.]
MTERLLQFIWRSQYFNHHELSLENGEALQIVRPGELNAHQGPDFSWAALRIGNTEWFGHIELHLLASGWTKHAHEGDKHYNNVILHVVWENDLPAGGSAEPAEVQRNGSGTQADEPGLKRDRNIPVLVLSHRVPKLLLGKYEEWMKSRAFVACERQLRAGAAGGPGNEMPPQGNMEEVWASWKRRLLAERLQRKTMLIQEWLGQNNQHWEETAWWLMARNFGFPVNAGSFEAIARSLPLSILARHRHRPEQLEALLLGQGGLLEQEFSEEYPRWLQKEFRYLRGKYRLRPAHEPLLFLRMRPANFPGIRLSQLGCLLHSSGSWFTRTKEASSTAELKEMLSAAAGSYWDDHFTWGNAPMGKAGDRAGEFGDGPTGKMELRGEGGQPGRAEGRAGRKKALGMSMKENIIINTLVPMLYAYGVLRSERSCREKALRWLGEAGAEKNSLLAGWARLGISGRNAADTQALLELKKQYCDPRKCLECAVGKALLRGGGTE